MTWYDARAKEAYDQLLNSSIAVDNATCTTTLHRIQCLAVFSVCEMGTPETLCLKSCTQAIEADCPTADSSTMLVTLGARACGNATTPRSGVSKDSKCFKTDYAGPSKELWVIGFTIAVVFSFLASVGINLQKKALKQNELLAVPKPAYRLPLWMFGFVLIVLGSILDFVAFGLAPQSLLAPLAALTLVWNMLLAPCFNKEKLSRKDVRATLVIFVGATFAVVFAAHTSPSYDLAMLLQLYRDPLTIVYFCAVALTLGAHFVALTLVNDLCLLSQRHRLIQVGAPTTWATVRLVGYAGLAGTLGGQSVLFAKSTAELLKGVFSGNVSFLGRYQFYLLVLALAVCLCFQVKYLNEGLRHYDALSMVPVYQAYWVLSGVLGGAIYFQEIRTFSVLQALMFVLGISVSIVGVVLLSRRKHAPSAAASSSPSKVERGFSFTALSESKRRRSSTSEMQGARVPESFSTRSSVLEDVSETSRDFSTSILEARESATDDSQDACGHDQDEGSGSVPLEAIDNYLATTVGLSDLWSGLGLQERRSLLGGRTTHQ
ncbi:hypothetical protein PsorP6_007219 [Peronosclerospora sorghi]|uniref:Uncharacterized protein n=1 Tax=Peronosclerospora sorghi TaxID=230839 RepID=A0ACC0W8Z8_9STRA|nr:hypothetical protein PsorP6_007219 [Peronosclerospora sorghi]